LHVRTKLNKNILCPLVGDQFVDPCVFYHFVMLAEFLPTGV
jgi:hypothetical protein